MKSFFQALFKYIQYFPDAKLFISYRLRFIEDDGNRYTVFTIDKKFVKQYKNSKNVTIERNLICRTLY